MNADLQMITLLRGVGEKVLAIFSPAIILTGARDLYSGFADAMPDSIVKRITFVLICKGTGKVKPSSHVCLVGIFLGKSLSLHKGRHHASFSCPFDAFHASGFCRSACGC